MSFTTGKGLKILMLIASVYLFFLSIKLMEASFKLFGQGFAESILTVTANPLVGLCIGLLATSIVQSSSCTTSILVGMVASGMLGIGNAIPIVMGANIGTSVTNLIVSFGHVTNREEFGRALAGAIVHDLFNLMAVIILFPLELLFHPLERTATFFSHLFVGIGGATFASPISMLLSPVIEVIETCCMQNSFVMLGMALVLLFLALASIVTRAKVLVAEKAETFLDVYLFRNAFTAFLVGLIFTSIVQSSSITTSIIVPLAGSGLLSVRKIFPYTLGANLGTTVTALLAALSIGVPAGIGIALAHSFFNLFGIIIIYPMKEIPITLAERFGAIASRKRRLAVAYLVTSFYIIPFILIVLLR